MSSAVFPTFVGRDIQVIKTAVWEGTEVVRAVSGKRTSIAYWSLPLWEWMIRFNMLRQTVGFTEQDSLRGFFNLRAGPFDSFLYDDLTDNSITAQSIGTGNGSRTAWQLVRTAGGYTENILAPNVISQVTINGTPTVLYTIAPWASTTPGLLTFNSAPAGGAALAATFTYYWPVEFLDKRMDLTMFLNALWSQDGIKMRSLR